MNARNALFGLAALVIMVMALGQTLLPPAQGRLTPPEAGTHAPEFTHTRTADWIGSPPLTLASLRGQVVLLDFWTFACWNCYRSFPWLNEVEARLHDKGFRVIGVHTPEFAHEKVRANIEKKLVEFALKHPVMIDNDFSYWNAMGNRYWPAFYLLDKQGRVRAHYAGETHKGDAQARRIEADIEAMLLEVPDALPEKST